MQNSTTSTGSIPPAGHRQQRHNQMQTTIPHWIIFVDTRHQGIRDFPRLVQENVNNTIRIYSEEWRKRRSTTPSSRNDTDDVRILFYGNERCEKAIDAEAPELLEFYHSETFGPYKSDICRIAALSKHGGYYFDNDMEVVEALHLDDNVTFSSIVQPRGKNNNKNGNGNDDSYGFSNSFIASTAKHVVLKKTIDVMIDYYTGRNNVTLHQHMGPSTLWDGYIHAGKDNEFANNNHTWFIDLENANLDKEKNLYPTIKRRRGWGCCCNYVSHNPKEQKVYFWSRFLGSSGSCRFVGGKTADDIE